MDFSLYRIKVFRPTQHDAFVPEPTAPEILREAILSRPTGVSSRGARWAIGKIHKIDDDGLYFGFGRESHVRVPFRDESGDYSERDLESTPFTHIFVDIPTEIFAVGHRTSLAANPTTPARQLARILNNSEAAKRYRVWFDASELKAPEEFLLALRNAYEIKKFTVYFTRPNPLDVASDFHEILEKLAQAADAAKGSTTVSGSHLEPEPLTQLAQSAAATGDDATARVRLSPAAPVVTRSLRTNAAKVSQDSIESDEMKARLLARMRNRYKEIRGDSNQG